MRDETRRKRATLVLAGLLVGLVLAVAGTAVAGYFEPEHNSQIIAWYDGVSQAIKVEDAAGKRLPVDATIEAGGTLTANQGTAGATAWPMVDAAGNVLLTAANVLATTANGLLTTAVGHLATLAGAVALGHVQSDVVSLPALSASVSSVPLSQAAGASDATTLRAVLATDSPQSLSPTTSACTSTDVSAANTVVLAAVARRGAECCVQDPTNDGSVVVNAGAASANGRQLDPALVAGKRGDCWPWPTSSQLVAGIVTALTTVTVVCCPY